MAAWRVMRDFNMLTLVDVSWRSADIIESCGGVIEGDRHNLSADKRSLAQRLRHTGG